MRTPEQGLGMIVSFGTDQKTTPFFELSLRFLVDRSIASSPVQLPGIPVKGSMVVTFNHRHFPLWVLSDLALCDPMCTWVHRLLVAKISANDCHVHDTLLPQSVLKLAEIGPIPNRAMRLAGVVSPRILDITRWEDDDDISRAINEVMKQVDAIRLFEMLDAIANNRNIGGKVWVPGNESLDTPVDQLGIEFCELEFA